MKPKRYTTAAAFRRALEDRLQDIAGKEGVDLQRLRRQVAFDRLPGATVSSGTASRIALGIEGWLRDGAADQGGARNEGYRPDNAQRLYFRREERRQEESGRAGEATRGRCIQ